jgi:hypothetical protein
MLLQRITSVAAAVLQRVGRSASEPSRHIARKSSQFAYF